MSLANYRLSFTNLSLATAPMAVLAELCEKMGDSAKATEQAIELNVLQHNTQASSRRELSELRNRIDSLPDAAVTLLVKGSTAAQKQVSFLAACLTYPIILHFIDEVLLEKIAILDPQLSQSDITTFFLREEDKYTELDNLTDSTKKKIRQVLIRILNDADIVDSSNELAITPQVIEPDVLSLIDNHFPSLSRIYLTR